MESAAHYAAYLERVDRCFGGKTIGGYGKWRGKLVKVLSLPEFKESFEEYEELRAAYDKILASGDTVNDAIVQLLEEHRAALLLDFDA